MSMLSGLSAVGSPSRAAVARVSALSASSPMGGTSRIHTPTTSSPRSASSAAATEESTPPLIATNTRLMRARLAERGSRRHRGLTADTRDDLRQRGEEGFDVGGGRRAADRDAQR